MKTPFDSSPNVVKPFGFFSVYTVLNAPPIFLFSFDVT